MSEGLTNGNGFGYGCDTMKGKRFVQLFGYHVSVEDIVAFEEIGGFLYVYMDGGHRLQMDTTYNDFVEALQGYSGLWVTRTDD